MYWHLDLVTLTYISAAMTLTKLTSTFQISSSVRPLTTKPCIVLLLSWLCRYLDSVTLTYISHSIDFYTFYVALPFVLNYKAFNHQTLYSASSRCTDLAGTLIRWPWPIFCTPVTLTYFMLRFDISSNIRPSPCIVLHLIVLAWRVPWPGELDLYLTYFTLMIDNSPTIRPTTTISCIVLLLDERTWRVPWPWPIFHVPVTFTHFTSTFHYHWAV